MEIKSFTFNPFSENTYVLYDETKHCVIVDPGCAFPEEEKELLDFVEKKGLTVDKIILTHAHVDHIMGCDFVANRYKVGVVMHADDLFLLERGPQIGTMYGFPVKKSPNPELFLKEGDVFSFGNTLLDVLHTPGHSPGSISFVHNASKSIISGDVLFLQSIGRTDLPGGDLSTLVQAIKTKLFPLGDDYKVYSGHGPVTRIGDEKNLNPFLR